MGQTKIEWCSHVWNPITGCTPISEACTACYAARIAKRFWKGRPFSDIQFHDDRLDDPLKWRKPRRVFVGSMTDLFHEKIATLDIGRVLNTIDRHIEESKSAGRTPSTFMILTKRPKRMAEVVGAWLDMVRKGGVEPDLHFIWFGITAENMARYEERIPYLIQTPAVVRFASLEPLLGRIDLCLDGTTPKAWGVGYKPIGDFLNWVIVGAETGPGARSMRDEWAAVIYRECRDFGIPFFFKKNTGGGDAFLNLRPGQREEDYRISTREFPETP